MIVTGENIYVLKHLLDKSDFEMSFSQVSQNKEGGEEKKKFPTRKGQTMRK